MSEAAPSKLERGVSVYCPPAVAIALVGIAAKMWATPVSAAPPDQALGQRLTALDGGFVSLDSRERNNRDEIMRMLLDLRTSVGRIEGALGTKDAR